MIENTRYVALELGIHALKPYDSPSVLRRRFGDCKDKATLMVTMLREAGVEAEVALVRTRDRGPLDTTVPTLAAFDHAIVHVPGDEELWLGRNPCLTDLVRQTQNEKVREVPTKQCRLYPLLDRARARS